MGGTRSFSSLMAWGGDGTGTDPAPHSSIRRIRSSMAWTPSSMNPCGEESFAVSPDPASPR